MAQHELFNADEMVRLTPEDTLEAMEKFKSTGRQQGDSVSDQIMARATHIIRVKLRSMGVDLEAEARSEGWDVDDYIEELDIFYELTSDLARAYLEGLETTMPFPFLN